MSEEGQDKTAEDVWSEFVHDPEQRTIARGLVLTTLLEALEQVYSTIMVRRFEEAHPEAAQELGLEVQSASDETDGNDGRSGRVSNIG